MIVSDKNKEQKNAIMDQLLCGACEQVITPPLGLEIPGYFKVRVADAVKSDLKVHAIVLENGNTRLAIIHIDILDFQASLAKAIRRRLWESLKIPASHVMVAATHTHTGSPTNYQCLPVKASPKHMKRVIEQTVLAVEAAYHKRVPVQMGFAYGEEKRVAFNRNYRMNDGTILTNPGKRRPHDVVSPLSPIDHTLGVIRFDALDGTPVAQIVNFACHPDTVGGSAYCADYPGELCRLQQERFGSDFVTVYLNGASGNVNHINAEWFKTPGFALDKENHYKYMGKVLSDGVLALHGQLKKTSGTELSALAKTYRAPRRQPSNQDIAWAKQVNQDPQADTDDRIYAKELTFLHKHPKRFANVEIQVFRMGD